MRCFACLYYLIEFCLRINFGHTLLCWFCWMLFVGLGELCAVVEVITTSGCLGGWAGCLVGLLLVGLGIGLFMVGSSLCFAG